MIKYIYIIFIFLFASCQDAEIPVPPPKYDPMYKSGLSYQFFTDINYREHVKYDSITKVYDIKFSPQESKGIIAVEFDEQRYITYLKDANDSFNSFSKSLEKETYFTYERTDTTNVLKSFSVFYGDIWQHWTVTQISNSQYLAKWDSTNQDKYWSIEKKFTIVPGIAKDGQVESVDIKHVEKKLMPYDSLGIVYNIFMEYDNDGDAIKSRVNWLNKDSVTIDYNSEMRYLDPAIHSPFGVTFRRNNEVAIFMATGRQVPAKQPLKPAFVVTVLNSQDKTVKANALFAMDNCPQLKSNGYPSCFEYDERYEEDLNK